MSGPAIPSILILTWFRSANTSNSQNGFYSSTFYVDNLLGYLQDHERGGADEPFFAFLPFAAPHWPLQVYPEDRDKYKGLYNDGPDELRLRRLEGLKREGLISPGVVPHSVMARTAEWSAMPAEERTASSRAMEVYAGMVDRMDVEIGRVLDYLELIGKMDDTVVIFMSDNGAEGAALGKSCRLSTRAELPEAAPVMGMRLLEAIDRYYDNRLVYSVRLG